MSGNTLDVLLLSVPVWTKSRGVRSRVQNPSSRSDNLFALSFFWLVRRRHCTCLERKPLCERKSVRVPHVSLVSHGFDDICRPSEEGDTAAHHKVIPVVTSPDDESSTLLLLRLRKIQINFTFGEIFTASTR